MAFSHFPSSKLEKLGVRKACRERFRIFCGTLSGTQSSHAVISRSNQREKRCILYSPKEMSSLMPIIVSMIHPSGVTQSQILHRTL